MVNMIKQKTEIKGLGRMGAETTERLGKLPNGYNPVSHAEAIKKSPYLNLHAICDINTEKNKKFSKKYSVPNVYNNYKDLIKIEKPSIISIATRTNIKEEIINYAINHGVKGIYVEKPLGLSINQCESILNNAKKTNTHVVYGTQRRGIPFFHEVKNLAHSGKFGNIQNITFEYGQSLLLWSLPHITDLITFFTNCSNVKYISALCNFKNKHTPKTSKIDEDPIVKSATITMNNGITSCITPGIGRNIRIHLDHAIISITGDGYCMDIFTEREYKGRLNHIERIIAKPSKSGTQKLLEDLALAVINNTKLSYVSNDEILGGTTILFGIVESGLRNGTIINYKRIRKDLVITGKYGELYA